MEIMDNRSEIKEIYADSPEYPRHLRDIPRAPKKLYCIGNTELMREPGIAIVGTRRCSSYGSRLAYEAGKMIASCFVTVVSGMAEGIDARAHLGCLDAGGSTIAVLGTGIDVCYPPSNRDLYRRIAEKGLIVSEYGPGDRTGPWAFPERNRIISGLSNAVIVVEGALKSGSMITANIALEQGRDVFAVPGNIYSANSEGVNRLIRDGAMPITSVEEIPELLGIYNMKRRSSCSEEELLMLKLISERPGADERTLALCMAADISEVTRLAGILEEKKLLRRKADGLFLL